MLSVAQSTATALTAWRDFFISTLKDLYAVLQNRFIAFLLDKNRWKCAGAHV